ncbi:2-dehydro-3-deoxygalactonokinase [Ferrovibrio sp.]|uniref:2-dehydro-3-deoxygalactonokinase n=1 Tax=Ferrovibrio sp. TaxID=1917215 RepID=UPI003D27AAEE
MITVDWGSTGFRAWRLDAEGRVLERRSAPLGITQLEAGEHGPALQSQVGDWIGAGETHILASGMIGSRNGWVEMPYIDCPAGLADIAGAVRRIDWVGDAELIFCPGLSCRDADGVPDVMRGEEMQVFGVAGETGNADLCLPGTHSKAVTLRAGRITGFATYFTGELYALLRSHGLLSGLLQTETQPETKAFAEGVKRSGEAGNLLHHLFGVRARGLFGELSGPAASAYLSGMLIGHELRGHAPAARLLLVGEQALCLRYADAARLLGRHVEIAPIDAAARGLHRLSKLLP